MEKRQKIFYFLTGFVLSLVVIISIFPFLMTPSKNEGTPIAVISGDGNEYLTVFNTDVLNVLKLQDGTKEIVELLIKEEILSQYVDFTDVMQKEVDNKVAQFESYAIMNSIPMTSYLKENNFFSLEQLRLHYVVDVMLKNYALQKIEGDVDSFISAYHPKVVDVITTSSKDKADMIYSQLQSDVPFDKIKASNKSDEINFNEMIIYNGSTQVPADVLDNLFQLTRYEYSMPILINDEYYIFRMLDNNSNSQQVIAKLANVDKVKNQVLSELLSKYSITYKENFK